MPEDQKNMMKVRAKLEALARHKKRKGKKAMSYSEPETGKIHKK